MHVKNNIMFNIFINFFWLNGPCTNVWNVVFCESSEWSSALSFLFQVYAIPIGPIDVKL